MRSTLRTALAVLVVAVVAPAAHAGSIDWSGSIGLSAGDDAYLNLSLSHFDRDGTEALHVARRLPHPEAEVPVLLFLARESGKSMNFVLNLRLKGLSWWQIRARLGVPPERVFVALPRDPGPPYGKAHGHYKHGKHRGTDRLVISDAEFTDWVGVRILSTAYGVEPIVVFEARRTGVSLADFAVAKEKARRHKRHHAVTGKKHGGARAKGRGHGHKGRNR